MDEEPQSKGWWRTVPGMLTATAGIITAVTGLIVALNQTGIFDGEKQKAPQVQSDATKESKTTESPVARPPAIPKDSSTSQAASYPVALPAGSEVVRVGDFVYRVLAAQLDQYAPNKLSFRVEVRMTNNGRYPANFWAASFRLLVDGVPRSPANNLNELVDANSAKEGIVEFVIPDTTTVVGLQIGEVGEGAPAISIALKAAKP
jgi:hypothetical protein